MRTWTRAFAESAKTKKMMTQAHVTPIGAQPAQHSTHISFKNWRLFGAHARPDVGSCGSIVASHEDTYNWIGIMSRNAPAPSREPRPPSGWIRRGQ